MANKADTSIDQLINIIQYADGSKQILNNLNDALRKTIPTISKRKQTMTDTNLNRIFRIKRINYFVVAKIVSSSGNIYNAEIISVDGQSFNKVGDTLSISKRELQLTGQRQQLH